MEKSPEQLKAEQIYYEAMHNHGFDPNAKVWVIEPKTYSIGAMPHNYQDFNSETAKQIIDSIKKLFNKDNKNDK
jgi:hypothetical protein